MKTIYVEIYHKRLYDEDAQLVKHSLEFDGKELKVLGMIPHSSKIIIDKENIAIFRSILDQIENNLEPNPRTANADTSTLQKNKSYNPRKYDVNIRTSPPCGSCLYECDEKECAKRCAERKKKDYSCYVYSD